MERTKPSKQIKSGTILTNDPSMTAWGWAVVNGKGEVLDVGCIKTESQARMKRIRKGDDTCRRVSEINYALLGIIRTYQVQLVVSELPHGSQSASAAVMIGIVTGLLQALCDTLGLPLEWYSEGDAKKALHDKRTVSKEDTIIAIKDIYRVPWTHTKFRDEAIADAMAVYHVAAQQSAVLKFMLK